MSYRLVKVEPLSGKCSSIYSIIENDDEATSLEQFLADNIVSFKSETENILMRLKTIGHKTGARESFFKTFEGKPGDGVCALYDEPGSHLRLYCIRFANQLVVVGSGGHKPKSIRTLQEDEKLKNENAFLCWLSAEITSRIIDKEISYCNDFRDFTGNLEFHD